MKNGFPLSLTVEPEWAYHTLKTSTSQPRDKMKNQADAWIRIAMSLAMENAQSLRHEFLTLEHILLALLKDPDTARLLKDTGVNLK